MAYPPYPRSRDDKEFQKFKESILGQAGVTIIDAVDANVTLFDPSDFQPDYVGMNENRLALETDTDWAIMKFTYVAAKISKIERLKGAWSARAGLF